MELFLIYVLPILAANLIHHFLIIRYNLFEFLAQPVDFGWSPGGKRLFGKSKTFRGFVVNIFLGALFTTLVVRISLLKPNTSMPTPLLGAIVGAMYSLGELPTSFLKRRNGINPSAQADGWKGTGFYVLEQSDSVVFSAVTAGLIGNLNWGQTGFLIGSGIGLHVLIDTGLYLTGYKKGLSPPGIFKKWLSPKR